MGIQGIICRDFSHILCPESSPVDPVFCPEGAQGRFVGKVVLGSGHRIMDRCSIFQANWVLRYRIFRSSTLIQCEHC